MSAPDTLIISYLSTPHVVLRVLAVVEVLEGGVPSDIILCTQVLVNRTVHSTKRNLQYHTKTMI